MAKYLHFFKDKAEHDDAYDITGGDVYKRPWAGTIPKFTKGAPYFITYNKNVSPSTNLLDFAYVGGTLSVQIESDFPWSATCDENWITLSGANGSSGVSVLYVTTSENVNGPRETKILLSDEKNWIKFITVRQGELSVTIPSVIWIDDFEEPEDIAQGAGYNTFEEYMDAYIENPPEFGSNCYRYTNDIMTYMGGQYYLYEFDNSYFEGDTVYYGLLPVGYNYNDLYTDSMETDYSNRFEPFAFLLNVDGETKYWENTGEDETYVLVKVEE